MAKLNAIPAMFLHFSASRVGTCIRRRRSALIIFKQIDRQTSITGHHHSRGYGHVKEEDSFTMVALPLCLPPQTITIRVSVLVWLSKRRTTWGNTCSRYRPGSASVFLQESP